MLYYDRMEGIDVSEGINVNETSEWKECDICRYWNFLDKGFNFQLHVDNEFHDLLMMPEKFSGVAHLNIKGVDYGWIISEISNSEVINLIQNINLTKKSGTL